MKKVYLLGLLAGISLTGFAQTDAQLKQLEADRKFLATTDLVYPYIDSSPGYPGGNEKWAGYVDKSNLIKTAVEKAKTQNVPAGKYTVIVKFAVNADSTISDVKTINKPVGYGFEEAAIKLVQGSGKWIPAHVEGKNTKGYLQLPVNFTVTRQ